MKQYKDASNRLSLTLSGVSNDLGLFIIKMIRFYGDPLQKVIGLDQAYLDFNINGVIVVLHAEHYLGVSIHVKDGTHDALLHDIASELINEE